MIKISNIPFTEELISEVRKMRSHRILVLRRLILEPLKAKEYLLGLGIKVDSETDDAISAILIARVRELEAHQKSVPVYLDEILSYIELMARAE